jgi:hypothetical protein
LYNSDALRREIAKSHLAVIARSESDEAIQLWRQDVKSWIASSHPPSPEGGASADKSAPRNDGAKLSSLFDK